MITEDNFDDTIGDESFHKPKLTRYEEIEWAKKMSEIIKRESDKMTPEQREEIRILGEKFQKEDEENNKLK